jgi:hypothetical protein
VRKPNIKACPLPFTTSFVKKFSPYNCFLYGTLCGFQIDLPKINITIGVIANILACFIESMAKTHVYQGITSVRRTHLTIKVRVHPRVDKLPPSSFT